MSIYNLHQQEMWNMKVLLTYSMESTSLLGESGRQEGAFRGPSTNTPLLRGAGLGVQKSW